VIGLLVLAKELLTHAFILYHGALLRPRESLKRAP
jgi:hypothetical protein